MTYEDYESLLLTANTAKSLETLLRCSPANGIAYAKLARLELASRDSSPQHLKKATHYTSQAKRWAPTAYETFLCAAELDSAKGDNLKALPQIETGIALAPNNPDGWHIKSKILTRLNRLPEAELARQTAHQLSKALENN